MLLNTILIISKRNQNVLRLGEATILKPVLDWTYSRVVPYAISINTNFPFWFSKTANSVITILTTPLAVNGKLHTGRSFFEFLAVCSITTITFDPQATKSIAPPIPFTSFFGIIQLAMSQVSLISIAPSMVKSKCPPLMMANDWEDEKKEAPGKTVIVACITIKLLFQHLLNLNPAFLFLDKAQHQKHRFNFASLF